MVSRGTNMSSMKKGGNLVCRAGIIWSTVLILAGEVIIAEEPPVLADRGTVSTDVGFTSEVSPTILAETIRTPDQTLPSDEKDGTVVLEDDALQWSSNIDGDPKAIETVMGTSLDAPSFRTETVEIETFPTSESEAFPKVDGHDPRFDEEFLWEQQAQGARMQFSAVDASGSNTDEHVIFEQLDMDEAHASKGGASQRPDVGQEQPVIESTVTPSKFHVEDHSGIALSTPLEEESQYDGDADGIEYQEAQDAGTIMNADDEIVGVLTQSLIDDEVDPSVSHELSIISEATTTRITSQSIPDGHSDRMGSEDMNELNESPAETAAWNSRESGVDSAGLDAPTRGVETKANTNQTALEVSETLMKVDDDGVISASDSITQKNAVEQAVVQGSDLPLFAGEEEVPIDGGGAVVEGMDEAIVLPVDLPAFSQNEAALGFSPIDMSRGWWGGGWSGWVELGSGLGSGESDDHRFVSDTEGKGEPTEVSPRVRPEELATRVREVETELLKKLTEEEDARTLLDIWVEKAREIILTRTVPRTDKECNFSWSRMRCEPKCECGVRLRFGDYTPGRACRLLHPWERSPSCEDSWDPSDDPALSRMVRAVRSALASTRHVYETRVAPPTDEGCSFSLETGRCEPNDRCRLRFQWGDITPSSACRLVEPGADL